MGFKASSLKVLQIFKDARNGGLTIPLGAVRGSTGLVTTATPADAVWAYSVSANVHSLVGNTSDSTTKTSTGTFEWQVPANWKAGQVLTVNLSVKLVSVTGTGVGNNGSDIDVTCFKQDALAVGSDLCNTAAQTFTALDTRYDKAFVIDAAIRAGDRLIFSVVGRAIENNAGNGTLQVQLERISFSLSDPA